MIFGHPTDETLFAFATDDLTGEEHATVEAHLDGCTVCREALADFQQIVTHSLDPETWELVKVAQPDPERVRDFVARGERKEFENHAAAGALHELQKLSVDAWLPWLEARVQLHTAGMAAALLGEARKRVQVEPRESLRIVEIASDMARTLTDRFDRVTLAALALNELATVYRFLGRNPEALAAVEEASAAFDTISGAPDERARVAWNRATVLWALERFQVARAALDEPKDWFRSIGDEIELARIGLLEGAILHDEGDRAGALTIFTEVARVLEARPKQPDLAKTYAAIAFSHLALGNLVAARTFGERAMATYDDVEMHSERIRTRWMFAQLLIESGNVHDGLADLHAAAMEYESAGMVAYSAQVQLERVEVLLRLDRWDEAAAVARQLVVVYDGTGQRLSYVQALAYLREAVDATTATPALARYVRGYVGDQADLPFRPPATPMPS